MSTSLIRPLLAAVLLTFVFISPVFADHSNQVMTLSTSTEGKCINKSTDIKLFLTWDAPAAHGSTAAEDLYYSVDSGQTYNPVKSEWRGQPVFTDKYPVEQLNDVVHHYNYTFYTAKVPNISHDSKVKFKASPWTLVWNEPSKYFNDIYSGVTTVDDKPPLETTLSATKRTAETITLSWKGSDVGCSGIKDYVVYRDGKVLTTTTKTTYTDTGLTGETKYVYKVVATDKLGNKKEGSGFTTTTLDSIKPTIPENLTAKPKSTTTIKLSWSASTDNNSVSQYLVFRNGEEVGETETTDYLDTDLMEKTSYQYSVLAMDDVGNQSEKSRETTVSTLSQEEEAPKVVDIVNGGEKEGKSGQLQVIEGTSFTLKGSAKPETQVLLTVYSEPKDFTVTSNEEGSWELAMPTDLEAGDHYVEASLVEASSSATTKAKILEFQVVKKTNWLLYLVGGVAMVLVVVVLIFFKARQSKKLPLATTLPTPTPTAADGPQ